MPRSPHFLATHSEPRKRRQSASPGLGERKPLKGPGAVGKNDFFFEVDNQGRRPSDSRREDEIVRGRTARSCLCPRTTYT